MVLAYVSWNILVSTLHDSLGRQAINKHDINHEG